MKKLFALLLALSLLLSVPLTALASEVTEPEETTGPTEIVREPGQCGEDVYWSFEDGTLTITGTGAMDDFEDLAPWDEHRKEIHTVIFLGKVSYIGARAFRDYDALKDVDFGDAMYEIGREAFYSCDGLKSIELPASFKIFGEDSFRNCKNLKEIHCNGRFPSFRLNCMWESYLTIYFPVERPWHVETIAELEKAFHGRIEFRASDGSDPYVPTEPTGETTEPTEESTEPTEESTEPTVETTEPTEVTAEPTEITQAPTETVETEPEPEATEPTEPAPEKPERKGGKIGLAIIVGVLALLTAGWLIFRRNNRGGKYAA